MARVPVPTEEPEGYPVNKEGQQEHGQRSNHGGKTNGYTVPNPAAQTRLIEDLLDISRIQSGHLPLNLEPLDVAAMLADLEIRYREQLGGEPRFVFTNRSFWYPQGEVTDFATARLRLSVPAAYRCG